MTFIKSIFGSIFKSTNAGLTTLNAISKYNSLSQPALRTPLSSINLTGVLSGTPLTKPTLTQASSLFSRFSSNLGLSTPSYSSVRYASNLAPRKRKYRKAQKGRVPVRTGGSQKGNFVAFGDYGLRIKEGVRLTASVITACQTVIKRKVKAAKGTQIWLRVFPDIPVSSKGNESRMGKGKGSFEYWACRIPKDKILFEIAGPTLPIELAKEAFRLASDCLPVKTQFVDKNNDPHRAHVLELAEKFPQFPALKVPELKGQDSDVASKN